MTVAVWTASTHHAGFRCGGWACVRSIAGAASGYAGGARGTTGEQTALTGLIAGLRDLPAGADIVIHTRATELASLADILAGRAQPEADLGLWAQIAAATRGRRVAVSRAPSDPDTPLAFAGAWAALAMDKAKSTGAFTAAIPKGNLAKVAVL